MYHPTTTTNWGNWEILKSWSSLMFLKFIYSFWDLVRLWWSWGVKRWRTIGGYRSTSHYYPPFPIISNTGKYLLLWCGLGWTCWTRAITQFYARYWPVLSLRPDGAIKLQFICDLCNCMVLYVAVWRGPSSLTVNTDTTLIKHHNHTHSLCTIVTLTVV